MGSKVEGGMSGGKLMGAPSVGREGERADCMSEARGAVADNEKVFPKKGGKRQDR